MQEKKLSPTTRFSNTVEHYAKYRPTYPAAVIELLKKEGQLKAGAVVADIGSGTGIFAKLLLAHQYNVLGIEPNAQMREKAEQQLADYANFMSVNATAEATGLSRHSVDSVTVATAFHWFDKEKVKEEFNRILKPGGLCMLIWNVRLLEASPLMAQYEEFLNQYGADYKEVNANKIDEEKIQQFFTPISVNLAAFPHQQRLDKNGFLGRILSTSYTPKSGQPNYEAMMQAANNLFEAHQKDGWVEFIYSTKCYYGHCGK